MTLAPQIYTDVRIPFFRESRVDVFDRRPNRGRPWILENGGGNSWNVSHT